MTRLTEVVVELPTAKHDLSVLEFLTAAIAHECLMRRLEAREFAWKVTSAYEAVLAFSSPLSLPGGTDSFHFNDVPHRETEHEHVDHSLHLIIERGR